MKREKGQSLVEFALIIPLLVLLLLGIFDFGRIIHAYITIDHAGREAARAASVGHENPVSVAVNRGGSINLNAGQVAYSNNGTEATITITYPVNFVTPLISKVISNKPIKNTTTMRIEK